MSTERDEEELACLIYAAAEAADYDDGWHQKAADAILAAGYRKPREVTTAEQLDALPVGSVVLDKAGDAWQRVDSTLKGWTCSPCDAEEWAAEDVIREWGPATILHEPEGER